MQQNHSNQVQPTENQVQHKCSVCPRVYSRKDSLKLHERNVHGASKLKCPGCSKVLSSKQALERHSVVHSKERPFQCDECPKTFKRLDTLRVHEKSHSNLRPFKCIKCSYTFKRQDHLEAHYLYHTRRYQHKYGGLLILGKGKKIKIFSVAEWTKNKMRKDLML